MGKQLSIYLDETEARRLTEIAIRECRRPHDQARYFLLSGLGLIDKPVASTQQTIGAPIEDSANTLFARRKENSHG